MNEANSGRSKIRSRNKLHWRVGWRMKQIQDGVRSDPVTNFIVADQTLWPLLTVLIISKVYSVAFCCWILISVKLSYNKRSLRSISSPILNWFQRRVIWRSTFSSFFMFCESCAVKRPSVEKRSSSPGDRPLISILRPVGVSPWARDSTL